MVLLIVHITVALASIVSTSVLAVLPSRRKLFLSYSLIGATLVSGTYLVLSTHQPILKSCISGLAYLGLVMIGLAIAHYRAAGLKQRTDRIS